jgi:hypothetical protein
MAMHSKSDRKTRGRTSISGRPNTREMGRGDTGPNPTEPFTPQEVRREASRPVSPGAGKHRGDRRDTSPTYTGNEKHSARGNMPRKDVKTLKR